MTEELFDGEYYWIKPINNKYGFDDSLLIGQLDEDKSGWGNHHVNLCGTDHIFYLSDFDVIKRVERP